MAVNPHLHLPQDTHQVVKNHTLHFLNQAYSRVDQANQATQDSPDNQDSLVNKVDLEAVVAKEELDNLIDQANQDIQDNQEDPVVLEDQEDQGE